MTKIIGLRREDLSKVGERRSPVSPSVIKTMVEAGNRVLVQPRRNPLTGEKKRSIYDKKYESAGAVIAEDIAEAEIIFGLKEIDLDELLPSKTYLIFSHTHKGQVKNKKMLRALVEKKCTLIDYELIVNDTNIREVTAFTYFAGYAGMIDSFWMLGKRLSILGYKNPFEVMKQSKDFHDMHEAKEALLAAGVEIAAKGTPADLPPFIVTFIGDGKTSIGAQKKFDLLPHEKIDWKDCAKIYKSGSRNKIYKTVLEIPDMYRLRADEKKFHQEFQLWTRDAQRALYLQEPNRFESNMDQLLPYSILLMNCILWAPKFQRTIPNELIRNFWPEKTPLVGIGDITCDPNGSIEFSDETWINDPVFLYDPKTNKKKMGFDGKGIAVMAVANLPCEFSSDASIAFSDDLAPFVPSLLKADLKGSFEKSGLADELKRGTILWKGEFTERYAYMKEYLRD